VYSAKIFIQRAVDPNAYKAGKDLGLTDLQAKIVAGRVEGYTGDLKPVIAPSLNYLSHPQELKDCTKGAGRIATAVIQSKPIGIITDYDVDGISAHALLVESLQQFYFPTKSIFSHIGHRLTDGYGLSPNIIERILSAETKPEIIITADCGSSDQEAISMLEEAGIDVIVTDHHAIPCEGVPQSAYAVVNPARDDCSYPDKSISGCMVSWLVMCQVRNILIEKKYLPATIPKLGNLLDYVALSTVADAVSLLSPSNRAVVLRGLDRLNELDKPAWVSFAKLCNKNGYASAQFTAEDLGFMIGPRINAQGRVDDPMKALGFLLAEDGCSADNYLDILDKNNTTRKGIEKDMVAIAKGRAEELVRQKNKGLVIYEDDFHPGVQGIVASRLVDSFGLPAVVFSRVDGSTEISGSARTIPEIHIRNALQEIDNRFPGLIIRFGGHKGAAGLKISSENIELFRHAFEDIMSEYGDKLDLQPKVYSDGYLDEGQISLDTINELKAIEPFGRGFAEPVFEGIFTIEECRIVGREPIHAVFKLAKQDQIYSAIWFRALGKPGEELPFRYNDTIKCAFKLKLNSFRGKKDVQMVIEHAQLEDPLMSN
jgi:single-stranded-DNA-specific exonuclease